MSAVSCYFSLRDGQAEGRRSEAAAKQPMMPDTEKLDANRHASEERSNERNGGMAADARGSIIGREGGKEPMMNVDGSGARMRDFQADTMRTQTPVAGQRRMPASA